jgi:hypothetical protein
MQWLSFATEIQIWATNKVTQRRTEDKNLKSKDSKQDEHVPHNNSKQWK